MRVVTDAYGRVVQALPATDGQPQAFPQWTTQGYTIELREIYAAAYDLYSRLHTSGRTHVHQGS